MEQSREDVLQRLEEAVREWGAQMEGAQQGLAEQLQRTRGQLDAASEATSGSWNKLAGDFQSHLDTLSSIAELQQASVRDVAERIAAVQSDIQSLREVVTNLDARWTESAFHGAFPVVAEDVASLREETKALGTEVSERLSGLSERLEAMGSLREEVQAWRSETAAWFERIAAPPQEPQDIAGEVASLREALHVLKGEVSALREEMARAYRSEETESSPLQALAADAHDLRESLAAMREDVAGLTQLAGKIEEVKHILQAGREFNELVEERTWEHHATASHDDDSTTMARETLQEVARLRAQLDSAAPAVQDVPDERLHAFDATGHRRRMGEILVEAGVISEEQLALALSEQEQAPHRRLGSILIEMGFTGESVVARVLASQLRTRFVQLEQEPIDPEALRLISSRLARHHVCLPLDATAQRLTLAMANPFDLIAIDDVELASRRQVDAVVATPTDINDAITRLYGTSSAY